MKLMHVSKYLLPIAACAALTFALPAQALAQSAKADGTWTWTMQGRQGGADRKMTLKLKTEGEKLTGKISAPARDGQARETEITEGKIKGNEVSFAVVREFNGNKFTQKYNGKVTADTIKGKIEFERNGETQSRDWEAKRETEKK
jgi:hypothetical protein